MSEGEDPAAAAAPTLTVARVLRGLFDINTMYESEGKRWWAWWLARIALWGIGRLLGDVFWELATGEIADDRSFFERLLTNAYLWSTLLVTGLLALYDRRGGRRG